LISALWEQLSDRKQQLRDANIAREKLFSVIGHDLRSPIANLKSFLDLLCDGTMNFEDFRLFQDDLRKGVNHVHVTLENLMGWGSFQTSTLQPRIERVSLHATAQEGIQLLDLIAKEKDIRVENALPEDAFAMADAYQIQSVMRNLLSNALKFTPRNGRVLFSAEKKKGIWHVNVQDNGIGMDAERASRL